MQTSQITFFLTARTYRVNQQLLNQFNTAIKESITTSSIITRPRSASEASSMKADYLHGS
uniref:Uncharacterized protein n=1 Tax=Anguilla anguilla TaxID=7936 RepID=A0A0E9PQP8_ANGAN